MAMVHGRISNGIDKQETSREQVCSILIRLATEKSDILASINAVQPGDHGELMAVMDDDQRSGVSKTAIALKPQEQSR
jgi:biopolymer transport protein ExbD